MTYQELYVLHLERALEEGGSEETVNHAVSEFNQPTPAGFQKWRDALPWAACTTCGDSFKPTTAEPFQEILCPKHAPTTAPAPTPGP